MCDIHEIIGYWWRRDRQIHNRRGDQGETAPGERVRPSIPPHVAIPFTNPKKLVLSKPPGR
jgi:hypothetical protein